MFSKAASHFSAVGVLQVAGGTLVRGVPMMSGYGEKGTVMATGTAFAVPSTVRSTSGLVRVALTPVRVTGPAFSRNTLRLAISPGVKCVSYRLNHDRLKQLTEPLLSTNFFFEDPERIQ